MEEEWRLRSCPRECRRGLRYAGEERSLFYLRRILYFCRLIDLSAGPSRSRAAARHWRALTAALRGFLDTAPGRVVNRPSSGLHNSSKPLHEATLRNLGFRVPESITSSDPDKLRAFVSEGPTISKALCGARADAVMVTDEDLAQFDPQSGPVHMQRCVPGDDARIHVVGREVIARARVGAGISGRLSSRRRVGPHDGFRPSRASAGSTDRRDRGVGDRLRRNWDFKK